MSESKNRPTIPTWLSPSALAPSTVAIRSTSSTVRQSAETLNFTPLNEFVAQLVFCGQPRNVDTVIVDGRVLKRGGELVGVDRQVIMAKCRGAARRLLEIGQVSHRPLLAC